MNSGSAEDMGLAAFAPAESSNAIQTPYGSLQLANGAMQQAFGGSAGSGLGGTLVPDESEGDEEEDDDDDDEDGLKKRKRQGGAKAAGAKKGAAGAGAAAGSRPPAGGASGGSGGGASGSDRDMHTGRRKIRIEFIEDDSRRHITFSKRKAGIMKKAYELATLTGTQVLLLIVSQTGLVYTFTTPKLSPVVQQPAGRELIQACLNAPEPGEGQEDELHAVMSGRAQAQAQAAAAEQQQQQQQQQRSESSSSNNHNGNGNGNNANNINAAHMAAAAAAAAAAHQQSNPSVYGASSTAGFHDPRQAALLGMGGMAGIGMNMPAHMHGMSAYGYAGLQQLVGHDNALQYGSYGGM